uniref:BTB/POZ domain-containing protein KCTD6-like n=1 Tax=Saccoglossus kowalevskii TaxID=10224 RepID=A0ABM0MGY0_SACKO|nr:PREDICTED: BTB/POZ domain-containing protein KCTD6-like [Saccoglossus kowalevskii]
MSNARMRLSVPDDEIVNLNVGGTLYSTTRSTLTRYPDTMLGAMFSGRMPSLKDAQGNYFIDRNGDMFKYILEFLRNGSLPEDCIDSAALSVEADFYQMVELSEYLSGLATPGHPVTEEFFVVKSTSFFPANETELMSGQSIIYASVDVLKSLPSIKRFYDKHEDVRQRLAKKWQEQEARRSSGLHYYVGAEIPKPKPWQSEVDGLACEHRYDTSIVRINHLEVFKDLTSIGFRLVSTTVHGSAEYEVNYWTFSRVVQNLSSP